MATVGYANVLVTPVFTGFQQAVGRQVNSAMPAAGATAGAAMAGGMASGLGRNSGGIVSAARTAAGTAAGGFVSRAAAGISAGAGAMATSMRTSLAGSFAAGSAAGSAMGTGFLTSAMRALGPLAAIFGVGAVVSGGVQRLSSVENARATLTGLGNDAETVEQAMESALNSVTGTAFGMDEAASQAAGLMAGGVEPGEELESTLRLVADSATIANTSMSEMGSIFNTVAATDLVQGDILNRLGDRGIPILQMLSDELGVSVEEVRNLASAGEIGFAEFSAAMESGLGGAALASGETTGGTWRNVGASVSRLGEAILEPIWPHLKTLGNSIIEVIDETIIPAFERAVEWVSNNKDWLLPLVQGIIGGAGLIVAIMGVTRALGFLRGAFTLLMSHPILALIGALAAGFIYLWQTNETFRNAMITAWEAISGAVMHAWENWIQPALSAAWSWIQESLIPAMERLWREVMIPAWEAISSAVQTAWENWIQPALMALWSWIQDSLIPAVMWLWQNVMVPAWNGISTAIQWAWVNVIQPAFNWIWTFINESLIPAVMWLWNNVFVPAWDGISFAVDQAWSAINIIFDTIKYVIETVLAPVVTWLWENIFVPAFEGIGDTISWIWENIIRPVWDTMSSFVEDTIAPGINRGIEIIRGAWNGLANIFRLPINFVLDYVWNRGIVRAFNAVAGVVGSDHRLDEASMIQPFGQTSHASRARPGRGNAPLARAEGGYTPSGWTLVGEEGPELVNFTAPNRVYTAAQTAEALAAGRDLSPSLARRAAGRTPAEALAPMGDNVEDRVASVVGGVGRRGMEAAEEAVQWVRGSLAATANAILSPLLAVMDRTVGQWGSMGSLASGAARTAKDDLIAWIRGHDEEYERQLTTMGGDSFALGKASAGGWVRPGPGPITSRFGPRWGGHHSGIDLAMPIGTPLRAPRSGSVIRSGYNTLLGRTGLGLMMAHDGWGSYFGHLSSVLKKNGASFQAGEVVALSGNTGRSSGPHLHFEVNRGNFQRPINPSATGLFDEGGVLSHGQMALNLSGKPEAVLTNDQWASLESFANTGLPEEITLVLADGEAFPAYIRRESHVEHQSIRKHEGAWR